MVLKFLLKTQINDFSNILKGYMKRRQAMATSNLEKSDLENQHGIPYLHTATIEQPL